MRRLERTTEREVAAFLSAERKTPGRAPERERERVLRSCWRQRVSEGEWMVLWMTQSSAKRRTEEEVQSGGPLRKTRKRRGART